MTKRIRKLTFEEIFSRQPNLDELKKLPRTPIYAVAENIRSMYNVGSIFRSSDGARLKHLFLTGYSSHPPRKEIDKTALGATDSVPWSYTRDSLQVIDSLKEQKIKIAVLEHTDCSVSYSEAEYDFPLCIVVGNEVDGISDEVIKRADMAVEIPMMGIKQSLNVSSAYGIVLYHLLYKYLKINKVNA